MPTRRPDLDLGDRAWEVLEQLHREVPSAIVIGGWAAYLRLRVQKSHDIDLIVDMAGMAALQRNYQLEPRGHLAGRKYKMTVRDIGVDVYAAYQSELGQRLRLPVEALLSHVEVVDGHRTLSPESLFVAKMAALLDRPDTLPGTKDRADMWALLRHQAAGWNADTVAAVMRHTQLTPEAQPALLAEAMSYLGEHSGLTRADKELLRRVRKEMSSAMEKTRPINDRGGPEHERL